VFVPSRPDAAEDDGYVMAFVYDAERNGSDVVIVHAQDFEGEPVATIADQSYGSGTYTVNWFGTDEAGHIVGTGAYIGYIKIDDGQRVVTKNLKIGVANGSKD
jgi:flagellar hook assembly protein FlgD